ncbi:MAG: cysteine hydrolase [Myxococcales bacterium]|nr:cysteine hydrolase [Myxococcales bacterium]
MANPANPADPWTAPDRDRIACLTIEVQRDTLVGGACPVAGADAALAGIDRALRAFRERDDLIVHAVRLYLPAGSNAEAARRGRIAGGELLFAPGTDGAELCKETQPGIFTELDPPLLLSGGLQELAPNEFAIWKPRWGAFHGTDLLKLLDACRVTTLVLSGADWPMGPRATVYEASARDLRVVVLTDATAGLDARGIEFLRAIGAWAVETEAFIDWFRRGRPLRAAWGEAVG